MPLINYAVLIDDEPVFNFINKRIIRASKFASRVDIYSDTEKAFAFLKQLVHTDPDNFPNAIFLDINMTIMDGWQFVEAISTFPAAVTKVTKVVILTSSINPKDFEKAKTYTLIYKIVEKPLTIETLSMLFAV